jgi:hypothetical protein
MTYPDIIPTSVKKLEEESTAFGSMLAICFRFHPNLILGGTYSGQIVLWDNRVQKRTPVQRTPLSTAAHTVICLQALFMFLLGVCHNIFFL